MVEDLTGAVTKLTYLFHLRVDFHAPAWQTTPIRALGWMALAGLADAFVGLATSALGYWHLLSTLVLLLTLYFVPYRLGSALAAVCTTQAVLSGVLVLAATQVSTSLAEGVGIVWSLWCLWCALSLVLRYLRTSGLRG